MVVIQRATDFNSVVYIDLKSVRDRYILWMVCTFKKFVKGAVINDKHLETVMKALQGSWNMNFGFPLVRFFVDNGGEFRNIKLDELTSKIGIRLKFGEGCHYLL